MTASGRPKDQFHFTYPTSTWDSFETAGSEAGFGFAAAMLSASPPRSIVVAYVDPGTLAAQQGLARGAQFLTVDGVDVATGADVATLSAGLFSPTPGTQYTFVVQDAGSETPRTIVMTAGQVTTVPVQDVGILPAPNQAVGYILFNAHIATAESELIAAVKQLQGANGGAGVKDLVLDMRYNGGGLLDIASELAYMIAGGTVTAGKTFERETFNDKNPFDFANGQDATPFYDTTQGYSVAKGQVLPQLNLTRVFVITGSATCSASEAVINGLEGVGVNVIQIGGTTCGKPYGFFPQDNCSTTFFAIQFEGVNAKGFGDYADGFTPGGSGTPANHLAGCVVADDFSRQLGDPAEARLAAALQYRANGTCPAVAAANARRVGPGWRSVVDPTLPRSPLHENRFITFGRGRRE